MSLRSRMGVSAMLVSGILPALAAADFVGLEVDIKNGIEACQPAGGFELNLVLCNFYAVFDHPGDKISNTGNPASVTTTDPNGYFQHLFGGDTAPQCALFEMFPDLACDSFVTIGRKCADDPGGAPASRRKQVQSRA